MYILLCLSLALGTHAYAQSVAVEGAAIITHPMPGDVLSGSTTSFYFSPGELDFDEWRITVGVSPDVTGIFDSNVRTLIVDPWEITFGAAPTDGKPVTMRWWQRRKGANWITFDTQYNTAVGAAPAVSQEATVAAPAVSEPIAASGPVDVKTADGDVVQSLAAIHRNGQTFITWAEMPKSTPYHATGYHVYRHTAPITANNIGEAQLLTERWGPLDSDTSINKHASGLIPATYVIADNQPPLSPNNGLFVYTSVNNETAYYAVTAVVNGRESRVLSGGENSLIDGVNETVSVPQPVVAVSVNNGKGRVYTQYMDYANWNPTFNGYAYNYTVTLPAGYRSSKKYPLLVNLHAYGEDLAFHKESQFGWQVIQLFPSDPGANQGALNSWWYGYAADHNYKTDGPVPTSGVVANFTEQRVMMAIEHLISNRDYSVDPQLVHAYGHSMGASGSLSLGIRYGNVLAGIYGSEAMTNYVTSPEFQSEFEQLWGKRSSNLPIIHSGPYADASSRYLGTGVWDWMNHHAQLQKRRGDKIAYLMVAQGKADDIIDWQTQGAPLAKVFNDAKVGFSARFEAGAGHSWLGFSAIVHSLFGFGNDSEFPWRYPKDLSFPSIQNASGSGAMRPGLEQHDSYNLDIEWATPHTRFAKSIVDKSTLYSVSLRSLSDAQTADITPRNTQQFKLNAGDQCRWKTLDNNNRRVLSEGKVTADSDALVTIPGVQIQTYKGTKVSIDCR